MSKRRAIGWRSISISAGSSMRCCICSTRAFLPKRCAIWVWPTSTSRSAICLTQGMVSKETYRCVEHSWLFPGDLIGSEKEGWKCPQCGRPVERGRVEKMSKSKKNIVDPEELINLYGADTARLFTLFAAPPEKDLEWSDQGVEGAYRFLSRLWRFVYQQRERLGGDFNQRRQRSNFQRNCAICGARFIEPSRKCRDDIEGRFHFNTAIAAIMELFNALSAAAQVRIESSAARQVVKARDSKRSLSCSRRLCRTSRASCGKSWAMASSLDQAPWPSYSEAAFEEEELLIVVQVNGKVRGKITVPADVTQERYRNRCVGRSQGRRLSRRQKSPARGLRAAPLGQHCRGGLNDAILFLAAALRRVVFCDDDSGAAWRLRLSICRRELAIAERCPDDLRRAVRQSQPRCRHRQGADDGVARRVLSSWSTQGGRQRRASGS